MDSIVIKSWPRALKAYVNAPCAARACFIVLKKPNIGQSFRSFNRPNMKRALDSLGSFAGSGIQSSRVALMNARDEVLRMTGSFVSC